MAQDLAALTNTWMLDPTMFDPTQKSNAYSNYNNAALPYPPSYNSGAGGPVNAATGQPIASFQQWQQQNPGGMVLNNTPAQPQSAAPQSGSPYPPGSAQDLAWQALMAQPAAVQNMQQAASSAASGGNAPGAYYAQGNSGFGSNQYQQQPMVPFQGQQPWQGQGQAQAAPQQTSSWQQPNNWQAALNSLANPGNPVTQGANVPQMTGSQPSGGVNAAFLQQAGGGQNMNQGFLGALRGIQGRPQS